MCFLLLCGKAGDKEFKHLKQVFQFWAAAPSCPVCLATQLQSISKLTKQAKLIRRPSDLIRGDSTVFWYLRISSRLGTTCPPHPHKQILKNTAKWPFSSNQKTNFTWLFSFHVFMSGQIYLVPKPQGNGHEIDVRQCLSEYFQEKLNFHGSFWGDFQ